MIAPVIGYFRGDDGWGLEREARVIVKRLTVDDVVPERWRVRGAETRAAEIAARTSASPLFGGGTVAIVEDPGPLLRSKAEREALDAAIRSVAPGNALVFLAPGDAEQEERRTAAARGLEAAVLAAGGEAKLLRAPREGQLAAWIEARARELGVALDRGAAQELARRVGGFVREGDVDRRGQGTMAVAELEKLGLLRGTEPVTVADVQALVPEAVPSSAWALLDAIGHRRAAEAGPLLDRVLETTPEPVVLVQLHRRIRELLEVADRLAAGEAPGSLVRSMGMKPFRVEQLSVQARRWRVEELERALEGVLALDAATKRVPGYAASDGQVRLAFARWVAEVVAPAEGPGAAVRAGGRAGGR